MLAPKDWGCLGARRERLGLPECLWLKAGGDYVLLVEDWGC